MTREFREAYRKTVLNEGYLSDNPNDRGGMTWKGIARNMHPNWAGWKEIDKIFAKGGNVSDVKANGYVETMVQDFYWLTFWRPLRCQEIIKPIVRNKFFDTAVLHGISGAVKIYQRSMGLVDDGKVTDNLLKKLNELA